MESTLGPEAVFESLEDRVTGEFNVRSRTTTTTDAWTGSGGVLEYVLTLADISLNKAGRQRGLGKPPFNQTKTQSSIISRQGSFVCEAKAVILFLQTSAEVFIV